MNIQEATPIELTAEERAVLEGMVRSPKTEQRLAKRALRPLIESAHQLSCDQDKKALDEKLKQIAEERPKAKPEAKKGV